MKTDSQPADITFIGSGISTSFSIISLLQTINNSNIEKPNFTINIIEKNEEFLTGIAYGSRSGNTSLLITSLADFLPKGEIRSSFISWLSKNKNMLIKLLLNSGGELSKNWLAVHKSDIEMNNWEHIYIPRRFFGLYIKERFDDAVTEFKKSNALQINFIHSEVEDLKAVKEGFQLILSDKSLNILSKKVVLSIGMPPFKKPWSIIPSSQTTTNTVLIENPYHPSLSQNLKQIKGFLKEQTAVNILILGSNASAMEMIYKTNDLTAIKSKINKVIVVSPQGELPNSAPDESHTTHLFIPEHLCSLKTKKQLIAKEIYNAAMLDLDHAEHLNYGTAITEGPISKAFISLLDKLSTTELREFSHHYGHEIGKRQRRAGSHYTNVVDKLLQEGKLDHVKGYFNDIFIKNDQTYFSYKSSKTSDFQNFKDPIHLVFNCIGSKSLTATKVSPLIDNLIKRGFCKPNASSRGFEVNNNLLAYPGFYVMGPLLAGNLIDGKAFWHIEHCGRIINLSKILATKLLDHKTIS